MLPGCTRFAPSICMFNDAELFQADRILWSADLSHDPLHIHGLCFFNPCWWGLIFILCYVYVNYYQGIIESEPDAKSASMLVNWYSANDCEQYGIRFNQELFDWTTVTNEINQNFQRLFFCIYPRLIRASCKSLSIRAGMSPFSCV